MRLGRLRSLCVAGAAVAAVAATPYMGAQAKSSNQTALVASAGTKLTPLSRAQAAKLDLGQPRQMIVILKNQFMSLAGAAHHMTATRDSVITSAERPVLTQLGRAHATHVKAFKLIDAISARMSPTEASYLRSQSTVRAVVPDKRLYLPHPIVGDAAPTIASRHNAVRAKAPTCNANHPLLEPEAISQIHFMSPTSNQAGEAAPIANGAGVTVAFMADGVDLTDTDFIRPNGSYVFTDAEDFSAAGGIYYGGETEGMLDASSIGAQGVNRYYIGNNTSYLDKAYNKKNACPVIRVVGAAPGANLVDLQVYGQFTTTTSFIEGVAYAVFHGVNVINQSFGSNPYPDLQFDPIGLVDEAAIADGVVVVASTGDAGVNGTQGSPATFPGVIAAGATTSFQSYMQEGQQATSLSNGQYVDNGISSLSSGGPNQTGTSGVSVVAPGDLNWVLCDPSGGCADENGNPTGVWQSGGTSESSPLTAAAAADVIQAYGETHKKSNGKPAMPSPALVKLIITSTATDLHLPSNIQGAGLLNIYQAVELARSWGLGASKRIGSTFGVNVHGCLTSAGHTCDTTMHAAGNPGAGESFSFTVTNEAKSAREFTAKGETLGQAKTTTGTVSMNPGHDPTFVAPAGDPLSYKRVTFMVAAGTKVVNTAVGWDIGAEPGTNLREALINPSHKYACYSLPQGDGNGHGNCMVHDPQPGKWTMIVMTYACGKASCSNGDPAEGYIGTVHWQVDAQKFVSQGAVLPASIKLGPGASKSFVYKTKLSSTPGDGFAGIDVGNGATTTVIPVVLRSLVPTTKAGGSFKGVFTGGNGRPDAGNAQTFEFKVPAKTNNLSVGVVLKDAKTNYNVQATLTTPDGIPVDVQSDVSSYDSVGDPNGFTGRVQLFRMAPAAGTWTLTLLVDFYSGPMTTEPYTGTIGFNTVNVQSSSVPTNGATVTPVVGQQGTITIKNTGDAVESYFADPRLSKQEVVGASSNNASSPGPVWGDDFLVPPFSSEAEAQLTGSQPKTPVNLEALWDGGVGPVGYAGDPDIWTTAAGTKNPSSVQILMAAAEIPSGVWVLRGDKLNCPCFQQGDTKDKLTLTLAALTPTFDPNATSSTGDLWTSTKPIAPLTLAPGQSGQITVNFTPPAAAVGSHVTGTVYVETVAVATQGSSKVDSNDYVSDEVAGIPYSYTVGG